MLNDSGQERIHLYFDVAATAVAPRLPRDLVAAGRNTIREAAVRLLLDDRLSD